MATNEREPMTDEMLDAINDLLHDRRGDIPFLWVSGLFDEACRARAREQERDAENAAMRPVVEYVASHTAWPNFRADLYMCLFCDGAADHIADIKHSANCYAEKARVRRSASFHDHDGGGGG